MRELKHALVAVVMVVLLVLAPVAFFSSASNSSAETTPASQVDETVNCSNTNVGDKVKIVCVAAGVTVLNQTFTLPQAPADTVTIDNPVPGPTKTVRKSGPPGPTSTVTITEPNETVIIGPSVAPTQTETVTQTTTVTPTPRQETPDDGTIDSEPEENDSGLNIPEVNLSPPEVVGLGALATLFLLGLVLLSMYVGYYLGYKDSDKEEAKFIRSLLGK